MRIVLAGVSGFLGTALSQRLSADGHQLVRLVRREVRGADEVRWDPAAGQLDVAALAGTDAVINLAGAGVGDRRWSAAYKQVILDSRVDTTRTIAQTIAALPAGQRPATFLSGSAIGWYGDTGENEVDESAPAGVGFLSDVCREWEAAADPAAQVGTRVVRLRTGLPLHRAGGFLQPQLLPFRLGLGGRFGAGRQWLPWISLADWLRAMLFLLEREVSGPVNLVGPASVRNSEFARALGRAVHRPAVMPIPGFALRALLGEFAVEALKSTRAVPGVLRAQGFDFVHRDVDAALRSALRDDLAPSPSAS